MATVCSALEAAQILDVTTVTVHRWARTGRLRHVYKLPGKTGAYVLDRSEIEQLRGRDSNSEPADLLRGSV